MQENYAVLKKFIKAEVIARIFEENEELAMLQEDTITHLAEPNAMLWELRVRLWKLVEDREAKLSAFNTCSDLTIAELTHGICSDARLRSIVKNQFKCEFLSRPIRDYKNSAEDLTRAAQARLWEVLSLPIKDEKGLPDKGLTKIVFDCAKMVLDRQYGQAIQKTELYAKVQSKSLNITSNIDTSKPEAIDAEIARLESALGESRPKTIEAKTITGEDGRTDKVSVDSK